MPTLRRVARVCVLLVAVGLGTYAVVGQRTEIHRALHRLGVTAPLLALAAALVGLAASALSWRAMFVEFGGELSAGQVVRVFFIGQLGKYVPGGVWPVLAQAELGRSAGARPRSVVAAAATTLTVNVTTGLVVAAAFLPLTSAHALHRNAWVFIFLPFGLVLLHPRVLGLAVDRVLRLLRREGLDLMPRWRGVVSAAAWSLLMWTCYGVHLWLLARPVAHSGHRLLLLGLGAYAIAWVVGFVIAIAPAGVGAREGMLVVALSAAMTTSAATTIALMSRVIMTMADFAWAAVAGLVTRRAVHPEVPETTGARG